MRTKDTVTNLNQLQKAEIATRGKVYKVVRLGTARTPRLFSALAGKGKGCEDATRLTYAFNKVTTDVPSGRGIFVYLDKDYAIDQATKMAKRNPGLKLAIYTAKAIGTITIPAGKIKTATCLALTLCEHINSIPVVSPAPVWEDVPVSELSVKLSKSGRGIYGYLCHNNKCIGRVGMNGFMLGLRMTGYQLKSTGIRRAVEFTLKKQV